MFVAWAVNRSSGAPVAFYRVNLVLGFLQGLHDSGNIQLQVPEVFFLDVSSFFKTTEHIARIKPCSTELTAQTTTLVSLV